jgi:hypothetical protein
MPVITTSNCCFILKFIAQLHLAGLQQISTNHILMNSLVKNQSPNFLVIPIKKE